MVDIQVLLTSLARSVDVAFILNLLAALCTNMSDRFYQLIISIYIILYESTTDLKFLIV